MAKTATMNDCGDDFGALGGSHKEEITLGYIEFYAGIGGWTLALQTACSNINCAADNPLQPSVDDDDGDGNIDQQQQLLRGRQQKPHQDQRKDITMTKENRRRISRKNVRVKRLASYEHSDLCNSVYAYNFVPDALPAQHHHQDEQDLTKAIDKKRRKLKSSASALPLSSVRPPNSTLPTTSIEKLTVEDLAARFDAARDADGGNIAVDDVIWVMSPPCQPHTRQHTNHTPDAELNDTRSQSFLHLLTLLDELCRRHILHRQKKAPSQHHQEHEREHNHTSDQTAPNSSDFLQERRRRAVRPPKIILVENVVGFERSVSCQRLRSTLQRNQYKYMEFHLNPTQVGVSNDRPRYYLVAILQNVHLSSSPSRNNVSQRLWTITSKGYTHDQEQPSGLTNDNIQIYTSLPLLHTMDDNGTQQQQQQLPTIELYLDDDLPPKASNDFINEEKLNALRVPRSTIMKSSSWCFDIVTASDQRSSCFTSSYSRMNRGTGSILYHGDRLSLAVGGPDTDAKASKIIKLCDPSERQYDPKWWHVLLDHDDDCRELNNENDNKQLPLRYFSQTEMARLMGFPLKCDYGDARSYKSSEEVDGDTSSDSGFGFPPWCTHKQSYRLLGNSINVSLSARLCQLAISEYVDDFHRGDQSES